MAEQVGRHGDVALRGDAVGDVLDVVGQAPDLLDDDDRAARLSARVGAVCGEVVLGEVDHRAHSPVLPARTAIADAKPPRGCENHRVTADPTTERAYAVRRALAHVRGLSSGPPLDPTLRVTLNFHPDRLVRGEPILSQMARTASTAPSSRPARATAG